MVDQDIDGDHQHQEDEDKMHLPSSIFLATLVALHLTPVSKSVGRVSDKRSFEAYELVLLMPTLLFEAKYPEFTFELWQGLLQELLWEAGS